MPNVIRVWSSTAARTREEHAPCLGFGCGRKSTSEATALVERAPCTGFGEAGKRARRTCRPFPTGTRGAGSMVAAIG